MSSSVITPPSPPVRRPTAGTRSGHTLIELAIVLGVSALLCAIAIPSGIGLVHGAAVRGARQDLVAALFLARDRALAEARPAAVLVRGADGRVLVVVGGDTVRVAPLAATYGVEIAATRDSLAYGPGGLGVGLANASLMLRRGARAETVRVSRLGRVRW